MYRYLNIPYIFSPPASKEEGLSFLSPSALPGMEVDVEVDHIMSNRHLLDSILTAPPPAPPLVSPAKPPGSPSTNLLLSAYEDDLFTGDRVPEACSSTSPSPEEAPPC